MTPVRYVVYRYSHHSPHSGYSRLAEYGEKLLSAEMIPVAKPVPKWLFRDRIYWRLAKGTPGYTREAIAAELAVGLRLLREKDTIFHFLYGETTYHYCGSLNHHRGNRILATFHLPPAGIQRSWMIEKPLQQLSAVVCVGTSQQDYLGKIVGHERVFFAPLGIDLDYYTPLQSFSERDPDLCLVVGDNYRDFATLRGVIELVSYLRPQTHFVAVLPQRCYALVGEHPNLTMKSKIPEAELLALYRSASLMVLPLTDATANNAVLEAMACGLPMVVTDVGSTRDYVSEDCSSLTPVGAARKMAECVIDLLASPDTLETMSKAALTQAAKFAWPVVMNKVQMIYSVIQ
ncbi:MAG: glycosyltransferase family 4 protein [Anaerolineae bacterium]|nr:glycosyltransferase family 4 protein [Anaerolineae bacterium]